MPGMEHVSIDYFRPLVLITLFDEYNTAELDSLADRLLSLGEEVEAVAVQHRDRDGAPVSVLRGEMPRKLVAREAGLSFGLQLGGRQNLGFFLDMAEARSWVRLHADGRNVLNLFAYTCAFSVVAKSAGANRVVNLDMAAAALRQGQQNHQRNGLIGGVQYLSHNLFRSWGKLRKLGPFELIIVDPPSRQPGSFVAEQDYAKVLRRLPELCAAGTDLLLCLNSPHLESGYLRELVEKEAPELEFQQRLPNPPGFADIDREMGLKVLHYSWSDR